MQQLTKNVYTDTTIRGCNPSILFTEAGAVFIDTAQWITPLLEMIAFAKKRGPIKYLINTEGHIDHIFGNHWFAKECPVIGHERLNDMFWLVAGDVPCYEYSVDVLERQDPEGLKFMPSKEDYIVNRPQITFSENMTLDLGSHKVHLYHTPGHCDAQLCVYSPEERTVFVGDTVFVECQTWLHSANIKELLASLAFIETLDFDYLVPGHGPVVGKEYIAKQRAFIFEWIETVRDGMNKGWDLDECIKRISFADRFPVDIGQDEMMDYIQEKNVIKCYNYILDQKNA